jgi:hypothetical protein
VTNGANGEEWATARTQLDIQGWHVAGNQTRHLHGDRAWFNAGLLTQRGDPRNTRLPGVISGVVSNDAGRLLVFELVPRSDAKTTVQGEKPDPNDQYDTLVEVIDPVAGKLIGRTRFNGVMTPFQNGLAYTMIETASGDLRIKIWRVAFAE